ncbi:MAG: hypothetical protein ACRD9S_08925 [Pyrinomonadaceae bacterium]
MRKSIISVTLVALVALVALVPITQAKGDGFGEVVKLIEQFYHVKHQGIPFLARAGIKTATTAARISGGQRREIAEAGSVKVAYFEDQDFRSSGSYAGFKSSMNAVLTEWSPLIQVTSPREEVQTYIYLRDAGDKFNVLVVTIERREACVVQVNLSPENLAKLMRNPDEMGNTITVEATTNEQ